ncbi:MAG: hypothetical protein WBR10_19270 [Candidatus Acidiferrum sp.]
MGSATNGAGLAETQRGIPPIRPAAKKIGDRVKLHVIRIVTEDGIQFVFSFLIASDGAEIQFPLTLERGEIGEAEKGQLPA